jgi:hypothetical protein
MTRRNDEVRMKLENQSKRLWWGLLIVPCLVLIWWLFHFFSGNGESTTTGHSSLVAIVFSGLFLIPLGVWLVYKNHTKPLPTVVVIVLILMCVNWIVNRHPEVAHDLGLTSGKTQKEKILRQEPPAEIEDCKWVERQLGPIDLAPNEQFGDAYIPEGGRNLHFTLKDGTFCGGRVDVKGYCSGYWHKALFGNMSPEYWGRTFPITSGRDGLKEFRLFWEEQECSKVNNPDHATWEKEKMEFETTKDTRL